MSTYLREDYYYVNLFQGGLLLCQPISGGIINVSTYFREEGENSSEKISNGELDKEVVHP